MLKGSEGGNQMTLFEGFVVVSIIFFFSLFFGFMLLGYKISTGIEKLTGQEADNLLHKIDKQLRK